MCFRNLFAFPYSWPLENPLAGFPKLTHMSASDSTSDFTRSVALHSNTITSFHLQYYLCCHLIHHLLFAGILHHSRYILQYLDCLVMRNTADFRWLSASPVWAKPYCVSTSKISIMNVSTRWFPVPEPYTPTDKSPNNWLMSFASTAPTKPWIKPLLAPRLSR